MTSDRVVGMIYKGLFCLILSYALTALTLGMIAKIFDTLPNRI